MSAIFKREFKTFFTSPIGYFVLAVLFGFSGFYFFATNMYAGSADLSGVFGGLFTIVLLLVLPVLTMRLLSDDKRQRTDQALLTAPVSHVYSVQRASSVVADNSSSSVSIRKTGDIT